jgi:hypothetical protein
MTRKATLAAIVAAFAAASVWLVLGHRGHSEPKSQIDQIELGRR